MSSRVSLLRCLLRVRPRDILPVGLPAALPPGKACLVHDSAGEAAMLLSGPRMPSVGFKPSHLLSRCCLTARIPAANAVADLEGG